MQQTFKTTKEVVDEEKEKEKHKQEEEESPRPFGRGVYKDVEEAMKLLMEGATQGHPMSMTKMGEV